MFCRFCGNEIKDGASFCAHCGRKVEKPDQRQKTGKKEDKEKKGEKQDKKKHRKNGWIRKVIAFVIIIFILGAACWGYKRFIMLELRVDKEDLTYEEDLDCYYLKESFTCFHGSITGIPLLIEDIRYEISDADNIVVSSGEAERTGATWKIEKPGMMLGFNTLNLSASMKTGKVIATNIQVVNSNSDFLNHSNVNVEDSDGDGIIDYDESVYKTDPNLADTDADGLSDYIELVCTGTDPAKYSTEDDGICDADRDTDGDGLSNKEEVQRGTDPGVMDTDGDGLSDGEEVSVYFTDPLQADTDGDGANDSWEIEHGYDPLTYNESFEVLQECTAEGSAVSVSVSLECGENPENVIVEPVVMSGLLDETMAGYLGSAYSFSYEGEFTTASIRMTFDETSLPENAKPVIYYFNEETQLLEEQPTTLDGNTAVVEVTHFSTYILLDWNQVNRAIEADIVTPQETENRKVQIAFAVDYSSSMNKNDPDYIRLSIVKEYLAKLREEKDSAALVQFAGYATTLVPLTSDKEMLLNAADDISNTGSDSCSSEAGTNGSDGLKHALDELNAAEADTHQYVILLTDGEDTSTSYSYDDLIAEALQKHILIYTVGMGDCNKDLLTRVAESTRGKFHYASIEDVGDDEGSSLKDAFEEIERETVDYSADSNEDGISDYYTRLICDGILRTGTGINPFAGLTYEEVQAKMHDYDGDGVLNGDEIKVTEENDRVYLKYYSSPLLADSDQDGYRDGEDDRPLIWDVGDRDLLIFSSLSYKDGTAFVGKMYPADEIEGNDGVIADNWRVIDYDEKIAPMGDTFSATTFKCRDNVIIAYRGTDDSIEWLDNLLGYGISGFHSEESAARSYAVQIASKYRNCNIYITGHSLGGYLAQIGAAELLENTEIRPERVAYFNGIGMNFRDYVGILKIINGRKVVVESGISTYHREDMDTLSKYAASSELISYEIEGDIVSSLGKHCGKEERYLPILKVKDRKEEKKEETSLLEWAKEKLGIFTSIITTQNINYYYRTYGAQSIADYFEITHSLDSFFYNIPQGTRITKE